MIYNGCAQIRSFLIVRNSPTSTESHATMQTLGLKKKKKVLFNVVIYSYRFDPKWLYLPTLSMRHCVYNRGTVLSIVSLSLLATILDKIVINPFFQPWISSTRSTCFTAPSLSSAQRTAALWCLLDQGNNQDSICACASNWNKPHKVIGNVVLVYIVSSGGRSIQIL